jgi:hypothetical protein
MQSNLDLTIAAARSFVQISNHEDEIFAPISFFAGDDAPVTLVCGALSSKTVNASLERSVTYRPFRSLTVACSTTSSEVVERIGFCGGAAVNRADQPPVGQWAVTTDDIARAITGHRRGMASRKTETSERGGSSRGARPRDLR